MYRKKTNPVARLFVSFLILTFFLLYSASVFSQVNAEKIKDYLEQVRHENGSPGISVAVAVGGKIVFSDGVGYAELDNKTPASGSTVHNIASISKVVTTVGIMQLVEQNKIDLDDLIQTYMPTFPEKRAPVTLLSILTHTSGIRHYKRGEWGSYGLLQLRHYDTITEGIEVFKDDPLLFAPGEYWSYSSHAFNLLQGVIEKASGLGFEEYLKNYVWEPAGMLNTSFDVPDRIVHKRGKGYVRNNSGLIVNIPYVNVSYKYASGGIISTVEDLVRLGMALNNGTLLNRETIAKMYSVQVDPVVTFSANGNHRRQDYKQAIGWRIDTDVQGRPYINHTGTVKGTRSVLINYPDYNVVVALQTNILPFDSRKYGKAIAQMFLPPINPK